MNGTQTRQDQRRKANAQQPGYEASTAMWQDDRAEAAAAPAGPSSSASGALGDDKCSAAWMHLFSQACVLINSGTFAELQLLVLETHCCSGC